MVAREYAVRHIATSALWHSRNTRTTRHTNLYPQMNSDKPEVQAKKSRWWVWLILLVIAGGASYLLYPRITQSAAKPDPKKTGKGGDAARPVPVVAALAHKGDMPVYLTGLGSVAA